MGVHEVWQGKQQQRFGPTRSEFHARADSIAEVRVIQKRAAAGVWHSMPVHLNSRGTVRKHFHPRFEGVAHGVNKNVGAHGIESLRHLNIRKAAKYVPRGDWEATRMRLIRVIHSNDGNVTLQ